MNKKLIPLVVAGVLFGASAQAADNLAGFYVGGKLVGAHAQMTIEDSDCWFNCSAYTQAKTGGLFGIQGGFNWISGSLLFGASAEYIGGSIEEQFQYGSGNGPYNDMILTSELKGLASIRGKMGLVVNDTAIVISGGVAQGDFEGEFRDRNNSEDQANDDVATLSDTLSGLVFGVGVEHSITTNLSIGLDYSRYVFDDEVSSVQDSTPPTETGSLVKFANSVDTFAVSVNWTF